MNEEVMERRVLLLLVCFILSTPRRSASSLSILKILHVSGSETWSDAQSYCRENHGDLITVRNLQEAERLVPYEGWIGLHRTRFLIFWFWKWSSGYKNTSFTLWDSGEPQSNKHCAFKHQSQLKWKSKDCDESRPFLCGRRVTVVQQRKTWEEALQHCRKLQAEDGSWMDLISTPLEETMDLLDTSAEDTSGELWVGLRFLAGEWLWMSGRPATGLNLPACPEQQQHCGALRRSSKAWKTVNCGEERAFLCGPRGQNQYTDDDDDDD